MASRRALSIQARTKRYIEKIGASVLVDGKTTLKARIDSRLMDVEKLDPQDSDYPEIKGTVFIFDGTQFGIVKLGMELNLFPVTGPKLRFAVNTLHPEYIDDVCIYLAATAYFK